MQLERDRPRCQRPRSQSVAAISRDRKIKVRFSRQLPDEQSTDGPTLRTNFFEIRPLGKFQHYYARARVNERL